MKMRSDLYERLRAAIESIDTDGLRERYRKGDIPRFETVKDLDVRYRWDLYWMATSARNPASAKLREDLNAEDYESSHIDTALRRIVPSLTAKEG